MATEEAKRLTSDPDTYARLDLPPETLELLPVEPTTGIPLLPVAQPGYYPGFSTLAQQSFWDETTRRAVLDRVHHVPPIRFFGEEEARLLTAVLDRVLPQDDRDDAHRIPLLNTIDERLFSGRIDGYRYEHMPPDGDAYRLALHAVEMMAYQLHGQSFVALGPTAQDELLATIHDGQPPTADDIWQRVSPKHFWAMLVQDAAGAYYAHPYAWDEIGFGGPAYPRGYMRQERGQPEPWEVNERRYAWAPPASARSVGDQSQGWAPTHPGAHLPSGGHGGTH